MAAKKKTNVKTKSKSTKKKTKNYYSTYLIADLVITLLLAVFMYVDSGDGSGVISTFIKRALCGLWGPVGYFMPVVMGGLFFYLVRYRDTNKFWNKLSLLLLAMVNVSAIVNLSSDTSINDAFYWGSEYCVGGGILGACVSVFMEKMVQKVASYIILSFTLIILASFVAHVSILGAVAKYIRVMFLDVKDKCGDLKDDYLEKREMRIQEEDYEDEYEEQDTQNDALTAANEFAFDNKPKKKAEKKAEKKEEKKIEKKPKTEKKIVPEVIPQPTEQFSDGIDEVFGKLDAPQPIEEEKTQAITAAEHDEVSSDTTQSEPAKEKASKITEVEKNEFHQELNSAIEKPPVEYVYPTIDLLNEPTVVSGDQREEMRKTAEKLIAILDNFGVKAKLLQVTQGPTVTRYEIQPDTGIKLSKIVGLADDIALNLAVSTVLIAPVPGKAAVGVEIPNKKVASVSIREILDTDEFKNAKSKLTIALGKDIGGNVVIGDIGKMPHVLIAGATGSGKSVCINTIIMSILYKASPEDVKLIMVDPKVVELGVYNGIPHLLIPVVTEPKKAAGALNWAVAEMMRRYELFKETSVRKLESYNKLMESTGGDKIPQIVIIIDELADLMMVAAKEVEDYIVRLTQLARAAGIHLIIATQRPSVDVITGLIKANVPSRIAFAVSSQVDSRTILDKGGAEKLLGMGDMLYYPMGARSTTRVQGAFVSDSEIERILEFIKENMGESHYSEDLAEHIERCATGENGVTPDVEDDGDPLLQDAIQLAVECGKISTSLVQRRLSVGYSRAGRIIDQMEARGIISGANGSKPRDVLISHADMAAVEDSYEEE